MYLSERITQALLLSNAYFNQTTQTHKITKFTKPIICVAMTL